MLLLMRVYPCLCKIKSNNNNISTRHFQRFDMIVGRLTCLCLASLEQITYNLPFLRTTEQPSQNFFTLARTFIDLDWTSFDSVVDCWASLGRCECVCVQIVRSDVDCEEGRSDGAVAREIWGDILCRAVRSILTVCCREYILMGWSTMFDRSMVR